MADNPWMKSVVLTNSATNYNLYTLMIGVDANAPVRCRTLQLQVDPGAGSAKVYILNANGTTSNWGVELVASQAFRLDTSMVDSIPTNGFWLRSDTASITIGVFALVI